MADRTRDRVRGSAPKRARGSAREKPRDKSPDAAALRRLIERDRADLARTLDVLVDRVSPTRMAHRNARRLWEGAGSLAATVGETLRPYDYDVDLDSSTGVAGTLDRDMDADGDADPDTYGDTYGDTDPGPGDRVRPAVLIAGAGVALAAAAVAVVVFRRRRRR